MSIMDKEVPVILVKTWIDIARSDEVNNQGKQKTLSMLSKAIGTPEQLLSYMKKHGLK